MRKRVRPVFLWIQGRRSAPKNAPRGMPGVRNTFATIPGSCFSPRENASQQKRAARTRGKEEIDLV